MVVPLWIFLKPFLIKRTAHEKKFHNPHCAYMFVNTNPKHVFFAFSFSPNLGVTMAQNPSPSS